MYVDGVAADDNYVYVAAVDNDGKFGETDYVANAFFPDGTQKVIDVKEKLADDTTSVNASTKGWFTYTVKNDEYTLKAVEAGKTITGNVAANAQITKNGSVAINAQSYVKGTNSTVFVVVDEDDNVKSYTGIKNVPSIKAGDAVNKIVVAVVKNTDGYAEYVYIDTADQATIKGATSSASDLVYILNPAEVETSVDEDDNTFYTYDAIVNGKETTINTNNNTDFANAGLYTDVSYDADGYVDDASRVTDGDDFAVVGGFNDIVTYKDGVLTLARNSSYALADNYSIYVIDAQKEVKTMTANKLANTYEDVALNADIEVVLQDDLATALYITLK